MKQRIKRILENDKIRWLIYPGGAGGEFLNLLINKYAEDYYDYSSAAFNKFGNNKVNRYSVYTPVLFEPLIGSDVIFGGIDEISEFIEKFHISKNRKIADIVEEFERFLELSNKKYLIRMHPKGNAYFLDSRSYVISMNTANDVRYITSLVVLKIKGTDHCHTYSKDQLISRIQFLLNTTTKYKPLLNDLLSQAQALQVEAINSTIYSSLCETNLRYIQQIPDFLNSGTKIMDLILNEAFSTTDELILQQVHSKNKWILPPATEIKFERILEKGYLESFFGITNAGFRKELLEWDYRNRYLIKNQVVNL